MLKKVLAVALAAAMIFGLVSVGLAAAFTDTAGSANEKAIAKLAALGILKGYEDGSFRPLGNITRAEFAAVVVRALGQENSAKLLTTPTVFPDCNDVPWAWGYINVASSQGIVKGYPDGTFGPNKYVTVAEAVTMLVRALGRDAEATGTWPTGHILVASNLGMLPSDVPGVDVPATRGLVAQLVSNVLETPIVRQNPTTGAFEPVTAPNTFLARNGATSIKNDTVTAVDTSDGTITFKTAGEQYYASNVLFAGAQTLTGLKGQRVDAILDSDGYVIYAGSTDTVGITGVVTAVDKINKEITVAGTQYVVRDTATVYFNGAEVTGDAVTKIANLTDAQVTLVLDSAGKVIFIDATKLTGNGTLSAIKTVYEASGPVTYLTIGGTALPLSSDAKIVRNGVAASVSDLKFGDDINYATTDGKLTYVDAFSMVVNGVLQEKVVINNHATYKINDVVYKVAVDEDGYDVNTQDPGVVPGQAVSLTLNRNGNVTKVALQTTATTAVTLQSTSVRWDATQGTIQSITLSDGTTATLASPCTISRNGIANKSLADLSAGDVLLLHYNATGKVDDIKAFATTSGYVYNRSGLPANTFEINSKSDGSGTPYAIVTYKINYSVLVKNGIQTVVSGAGDFVNGTEVKITKWNVTKDEQYADLLTRTFNVTGLTVKGTSLDDQGNTLFVAQQGANEVYFKLQPVAIVHRADSPISASAIAIGDKAKIYEVSGSGTSADPYVASFVYVSTDTTAPDLNTDATAAYDGTKYVTVTFNATEDCLVSYKVYNSSGTLVYTGSAAPKAGNVDQTVAWDASSSPAGTYTIVLYLQDYAGNVGDPVIVQVTK